MSRSPTAASRTDAMVQQAAAQYGAGRLAEAEGLCRRILALTPMHPNALGMLGLIALRAGHAEQAVRLLEQAARAAPRIWQNHVNLGHALKAVVRLPEAIAAYRRAAGLAPGEAMARYALGTALLAGGDEQGAEAELRGAARAAPAFADAHNNLGLALLRLRQPEQAEAAFRDALRQQPDQAMWHLNLALALADQERLAEALGALREAARLDFARTTTGIAPGSASSAAADLFDPYRGLIPALISIGAVEEAEAQARANLAMRPNHAPSLVNLANVLLEQCHVTEAEGLFARALAAQADFAIARSGLGYCRLLRGRLAEGWDDWEARHAVAAEKVKRGAKAPRFQAAQYPGQPWHGAPRAGRSLLVYPEQGLGDAIQMARFLPILAQGGPVTWVVPNALRSLAEGFDGAVARMTADETPPPHDLKCSIMSLPRLMRVALDTIPRRVPYLRADPNRSASWRERLGDTGFMVGIAWQGSPDYAADRHRSVPGSALEVLQGIPGVRFVSLQVPRPAEQSPLPMLDMTEELTDFAATAALAAVLDLIVSVDTAVAHLAGALGRPVWLLNRFNTDWRWMLERTDSPWYPTMRIFRQPRQGDWMTVLREVRDALAACARQGQVAG